MRVQNGPATRQRRKKWLKLNEGAFGTRHTSYRVAKQSVIKSGKYAYRDRRNKKREFRRLWILRLNAVARKNGITYSKFMYQIRKQKIDLNRKMLSELAIAEPEKFDVLIKNIITKTKEKIQNVDQH